MLNSLNGKKKMSNFKESLKDGQKSEQAILSIIQKKYPTAEMMQGYYKYYDIFVSEKNIGVEVKKDVKSQETGNLVVEVEFNGYPSALSTTRADYWVFDDGESYIWIETDKLRHICNEFKEIRTFVGNGDTKPKKAHLIPKHIIKNYSCLITNIP